MINSQDKAKVDMILLSAVFVMLMLGVLTIFSSSSFYGREKYGDAMIFSSCT